MIYQHFRKWLAELENLLFPQSCAGCGKWDTALCPSCAEAFGGQWSPVSTPVTALSRVIPASQLRGRQSGEAQARLPFPVWRLGTYESTRRNAIIRWKNHIDRALSAHIAAQLRIRGRELAPLFLQLNIPELALVPAPSRQIRKKEGLFVVGRSALALCEGLSEGGIRARVCDILRIDEKVSERRAKAGAISCVTPSLPAVPIVLVDDVLVTGSTLVGCVRALERRGGKVCCAFVLAQQEKINTQGK